jgi:hypothetical protein
MLAPVIALALSIQSKVGYGSELYNDCQTYLSYKKPGTSHTDQDPTKAEGCASYVEGFLAGGYKVRGFCPSGHAEVFYIQAYVDFMDKHPELLDKPKAIGITTVLKEQFPCSQ